MMHINLGSKRPDCTLCGKVQRGIMVVNEDILCGDCYRDHAEWEYKQEKDKMEAFKKWRNS